MTYIQLEKLNYQRLCDIISNFHASNDENVYYDFVFVGLLQAIHNKMNHEIMDNLQNFIVEIEQQKELKAEILKLQRAMLPFDNKSEDYINFIKTFDDVFVHIQKEIFDGRFGQHFVIPDFYKEIRNNVLLQTEAAADLVNGYMRHISHYHILETK
eukprot:363510_1